MNLQYRFMFKVTYEGIEKEVTLFCDYDDSRPAKIMAIDLANKFNTDVEMRAHNEPFNRWEQLAVFHPDHTVTSALYGVRKSVQGIL